jgi:hypothetical protein
MTDRGRVMPNGWSIPGDIKQQRRVGPGFYKTNCRNHGPNGTQSDDAGFLIGPEKSGSSPSIRPRTLISYLSTGKGLSAERALKLLNVLNCSRSQLEAKFGRKAVSSRIVSLQEKGRELGGELRFDGSSWVAREGDSAADPNNRGDTITDVSSVNGEPSDDEVNDVLRQVNNLHRKAIDILNDYAGKIQKARPNKSGNTESPKMLGGVPKPV